MSNPLWGGGRVTQERLGMMSCDLDAEVFHREIVKQEQEQLRRNLAARHEGEMERLQQHMREMEIEHNNEKIRMRWEHAEEVNECHNITRDKGDDLVSLVRP